MTDMRMWLGVKPEEMCDKHLRGEHGELHKLAGSMARACDPEHPRQRQHLNSIKGLIRDGFLVLECLFHRHAALTVEAKRRGRLWMSAIPDWPFDEWMIEYGAASMFNGSPHDNERDRNDLRARCPECAARMGEKP